MRAGAYKRSVDTLASAQAFAGDQLDNTNGRALLRLSGELALAEKAFKEALGHGKPLPPPPDCTAGVSFLLRLPTTGGGGDDAQSPRNITGAVNFLTSAWYFSDGPVHAPKPSRAALEPSGSPSSPPRREATSEDPAFSQ